MVYNIDPEKLPKIDTRWDRFVDSLTYMTEVYGLRKAVREMNHESELMCHLMNSDVMNNYISQWLQYNYDLLDKKKHKKDLEVSIAFKLAGNQEFQAKHYTASLESYTKSAVFAPSNSDELSIAIANRSASLFHLNRWVECIRDIKLALRLNYPVHLRYKLHIREAQCYLRLGQKISAIEAIIKTRGMITNVKSDESREQLKILEQLQKKLNEVKSKASRLKDDASDENTANTADATEFPSLPEVAFGENPNLRFASAALDLKQTPLKGRHVVANRDIKRGQVLFVEKAFTFVPLNIYEMNHVCHNCCRSIVSDVYTPCTTCVDVFYCNVECLEKARSYHCWECLGYQLDIWSQIGIAYLALKLLFISVLTTDIERFNELQGLVTNFDQVNPSDTISYGITASLLTHYLSSYTNFFESVDVEESLASKFSNDNNRDTVTYDFDTESDQRLYVSTLLLRYILQLVANGHAITKINTLKISASRMRMQQQDRIATAIYPSASMMNHSCDPNIINSFLGDVLIVKAICDIKKGEEVLHCYGPDFRRLPKTERQDLLKSQYCFKCTCNACTDPEYKYFMKRFSAIKCSECSGPMNCSTESCMDCGKICNDLSRGVPINQAEALYDEGVYLSNNNKYEEALNKLMQCLSIRREIFYKFHDDITITLDCIAKVYAKAEQWMNSIKYIELSMMAVEEKYGPSGIEICHELNKLTDICITYLQQESKTQTKFYKNILKKSRRCLNRTQEIIDLAYGSWSDIHVETVMKKQALDAILKDYNV